MKFLKNRGEGVSPVIAESLLLAITVALAAVVAAYAMGLLGHTQMNKQVVVTAVRISNTQIDVTYRGGPDSGQLDYLRIIRPDATSEPNWSPTSIGEVKSIVKGAGDDWSSNVHIVVVARFKDGTTQVILDSYF